MLEFLQSSPFFYGKIVREKRRDYLHIEVLDETHAQDKIRLKTTKDDSSQTEIPESWVKEIAQKKYNVLIWVDGNSVVNDQNGEGSVRMNFAVYRRKEIEERSFIIAFKIS